MSILRVTRHHVLVGQPLACRSGAVVSLHRSTIAFREPRPTARTRSTGPRHRNVRLRAQAWPVYRCLSIVRATQHHPLVGQPLVCRSGAVVSLHRSTIIITFCEHSAHTARVRGAAHRNVRLRAQARPVYRYLSIVRATQHHPLVGQPLVCRSGAVVSLHCSTIARCRERAAYKILFGRWRVTSCVGEHCYHQVVSGKLWDAQTPASRPRDGAQGLRCVLKLDVYRVTREPRFNR